jgi:hypothetical protein
MTKLELTKDEKSYLEIELNIKLRECSVYSKEYAGALNSIFKKLVGRDHLDYMKYFGGDKNVTRTRKYKKPGYLI